MLVYFPFLVRDALTAHCLVGRVLHESALGLGYRVYGERLACLLAVDVQLAIQFLHHDACAGILVRAARNGVEAAVAADGVVLAHAVFLHFLLRWLRSAVVWLQVCFLFCKHL